MKILIAGGGIGGLAAALCLARAGHDVRVFEQGDGDDHVGAGIQLSPNATRILFRLGLGEALDAIAFRPQRIVLRNGTTLRAIAAIPLADAIRSRHGAPWLHVHRGDLRQILAEALRARHGDVVMSSRRVTKVGSMDANPCLVFADGASAAGDMIVGADGVHSQVRAGLFGPESPRFTGYVAWRGLVDASRVADLGLLPEVSSYMNPGAHAVTYFVRSGTLVNFVGVVERDDWREESWDATGTRAALARDMAAFHPVIRKLAAEIDAPLQWALYDRAPLPRWSRGCVTLLGDACHPMLPFLAQGACMAIEDASILARVISPLAGTPPQPHAIAAALVTYEQARKPRTSRVQAAARAQGRFFHRRRTPIRTLTHMAMSIGARLAPGLARSRYDWLWAYDADNAPIA